MKAFPSISKEPMDDGEGCFYTPSSEGMELRDYFAAKAMPIIVETYKESWIEDGDFQGYSEVEMICIAEASYEMADAMMLARKAKSDS